MNIAVGGFQVDCVSSAIDVSAADNITIIIFADGQGKIGVYPIIAASSPRTFGHFGQAGTFLWVDPDAGAACVGLTDRDLTDWSVAAWPPFTDGVLAAL